MPIAQDPGPSAAVLQGIIFGRTAPHRVERADLRRAGAGDRPPARSRASVLGRRHARARAAEQPADRRELDRRAARHARRGSRPRSPTSSTSVGASRPAARPRRVRGLSGLRRRYGQGLGLSARGRCAPLVAARSARQTASGERERGAAAIARRVRGRNAWVGSSVRRTRRRRDVVRCPGVLTHYAPSKERRSRPIPSALAAKCWAVPPNRGCGRGLRVGSRRADGPDRRTNRARKPHQKGARKRAPLNPNQPATGAPAARADRRCPGPSAASSDRAPAARSSG